MRKDITILIVTVVTVIVGALLLYAHDPKTIKNITVEIKESPTEPVQIKTEYLSMLLGTEPEVSNYRHKDKVERLFDKYDVPYQFRDYTRQLCEIYNIDPLVFIRLIYRESAWGKASTYISYNEQRAYGQNKDIFDIGMGQLSSRYFSYFSTHHFDKYLLINLGYIRSTFNPEDDYSNLQVSASYLTYLLKKFNNDYNKAVMSYNAGETRIRRGDIPYNTIQYTQYIIKGEEC